MVVLGYGTYCLAKGRRGLMTSASLSTGASMILGGLQARSPLRRGAQVARAVGNAAGVVANRSQS